MPLPPAVVQWLKQKYPKPTVDPDWLKECYSWIESELHLNPATELDAILYNVETQLLQSNLEGSMLPGTGLPENVADLNNIKLQGPAILVEIVSITEIGHSAFNLQNIRQARIERADLAGLASEEVDNGEDQGDGEDAGPVSKYPRSMLRFQLSDGATVLEAIEYRKIPQLELGVTPLGYKMLLKNVFIRRGIAWLEPANIILKGYQTEERQAVQDNDFVRGLRVRLGKPEEDPAPAQQQSVTNAPSASTQSPQPRRAIPAKPPSGCPPSSMPPPRKPSSRRSPFRDLDEAPSLESSSTSHNDDAEQPRRRKVPSQRQSSPPSKTGLTSSRFFVTESSTAKGKGRDLASELRLSPHRRSALFLPDSDDETLNGEVSRRQAKSATNKRKSAEIKVGHDGLAGDASPKSSEYDFDFSLDEGELLATLDKVEKEQVEHPPSAAMSTATQRTATASGTGLMARGATREMEVIMIEDEDEDEKENVPLPTRRVRRRIGEAHLTSQPPVDDQDIIEVSD